MRMSAGVLCLTSKCDWRSRSLKRTCWCCTRGIEDQTAFLVGLCDLLTDQLADDAIFSGGSTLNGTPGGDKWARVLCGKIGWLSDPLHRVEADCSGCTSLKMWLPEQEKIPPHRKHTTKPTSAQRPRPPRDSARRDASHALAHTLPLPYIQGL